MVPSLDCELLESRTGYTVPEYFIKIHGIEMHRRDT